MRVELPDQAGWSRSGGRLSASLWRGRTLHAQGLDIGSWSLGWDADRQVQGQATLVVADPGSRWAPWTMGDPLSPGGSVLRLAFEPGAGGGPRVPLGVWRIRKCTVVERHRWRQSDGSGSPLFQPIGAVVTVEADEMTAAAGLARLDADTPDLMGTCVSEISRLGAPWLGVAPSAEVADRAVPAAMEYGESRLDAIDALLDVLGAVARMGPEGALEIVPGVPGKPVWEDQPGPGGTLVSASRVLSDDGLVNRVVARGKTETGYPLVGRADAPPSSWLNPNGPLGPLPLFHQSDATTLSGVAADAAAVLADRLASSTVDVDVEAVACPALQLWDTVTVHVPVGVRLCALTGLVVGMRLQSVSSARGVVPAAAMSLTVRVSRDAIETMRTGW